MRPFPNNPRLRRLVLVAACALVTAFAAQAVKVPLKPGGRNSSVQKQIERMEEQWGAALLTGDSAAIGPLLADSFVGIGPDGTITSKTEELNSYVTGRQHFEKRDVEERRIRVFGSTAVVTSRVEIEGNYSGKAIAGQFRYTRVWTLTRGQWQIVSFEASRVDDPSARRP